MSQTDSFEEMYADIREISGVEVEMMCRGLVSKRLSQGESIDDWSLIIGEAQEMIESKVGVAREVEVQATVPFRSNLVFSDEN